MPVVERVGPDEALSRVRDALGGKLVEAKLNFEHVDVTCKPENLVEVMKTLRDGDGLLCTFFTFLSAVDRSAFSVEEGEEQPGLEVLIHVYSPEHAFHVTVHVPLATEQTVVPSITGIYLGAEWHERETHEMFGIDFDGHPHLVGLYLPEDFEGHPLLKSFKLPSRALVKEWPGAKDPDEAAAGGR